MPNLVDKQCKDTGWRTPERILGPVRKYAEKVTGETIYLDPATTADNPVRAREIITEDRDGLTFDWKEIAGEKLVFLNPPYGKVFPEWVAKVGEQAEAGAHMVVLFPAQRFETAYYHEHLFEPTLSGLCFIRKRIAFLNSDGKPYKGNPYGSMVLLFNGKLAAFAEFFRPEGVVLKTRRL